MSAPGEQPLVGSRIPELIDAWNEQKSLPFSDWVRSVSRAFYESRLLLEAAARLVRVSPAEFQAVLNLATLDDAELELLSREVPPKTTWFLFAGARSDTIEAGLKALRERSPREGPSKVVHDAIRDITGPTVEEAIAVLDSQVFGHMAKKAKQYDLFRPKDRQFLGSAATRRRSGQPLTPRQATWATDLFREMATKGAIRRNSPDGDQEICDQVLDSLDRGGDIR